MWRPSVLLSARHPVELCGIASIVNAERDFRVAGTCRNGVAAIAAIRNLRPEIALIDTLMPGPPALEILRTANTERLPTRIVFFSQISGKTPLLMAMAEVAYGVISDDVTPANLVKSLRQVAAGFFVWPCTRTKPQSSRPSRDLVLAQLTDREQEIAALVSSGLSNKEIGRKLNLTEGTIKVHLHNVLGNSLSAIVRCWRRPAGENSWQLEAQAGRTLISQIELVAKKAALRPTVIAATLARR
jgi:two-component system nitrate/nitrite response regulator NarL